MIHSFDTLSLSGFLAFPFIAYLLFLAFGPLIHKEWSHRYENYLSLALAMITVVGLWISSDLTFTAQRVSAMFLHSYFPFIILIGALFVVTSGIHITTTYHATPLGNVFFLFGGSLLASLIGTTGASMLLIRPFLHMNTRRSHKAYLVVFFIFLLSNCGGLLTPIGDPPLFLGYLQGVDFFWPLTHLWKPYFLLILPLLSVFYIVDRMHYRKLPAIIDTPPHEVHFYGIFNAFALCLILFIVMFSNLLPQKPLITISNVPLLFGNAIRDILLLLITFFSYIMTPKNIHYLNRFHLSPLTEVVKVFVVIFITLIPVEIMLHQGAHGPFAFLDSLVNKGEYSDPFYYYFLTGGLSSVLDNAPTYLLFFHLAGGSAASLMSSKAITLMAISCGSVFMGAITYIGNAPNLLVKTIAEKNHIKMPSFLGYIGWSLGILFPMLVVLGFVFFG